MNWIAALTCVIVILVAVAAWLILEMRQMHRDRQWEFACPIRDGATVTLKPLPGVKLPGETQWDRMLREVGDPTDVLTTGDEFAMPTKG